MKTTERSAVIAFCTRVTKLEDVYVRARTGPNRRQLEQIWRIDHVGEDYDAGELAREVLSRFEYQPISEKVWLEAVPRASSNVVDQCEITPDEDGGDVEQSLVGAVVALTKDTREHLNGRELRIQQLEERCDQLRDQKAELEAALVIAEMGVDSDEDSEMMKMAFEAFSPLVKLAGVRMLAGKQAAKHAAEKATEQKQIEERPQAGQAAEQKPAPQADQGDDGEDEDDLEPKDMLPEIREIYADRLIAMLVQLVEQCPETLTQERAGVLAEKLGEQFMTALMS